MKRFRPKLDKLFWIISSILLAIVIGITVTAIFMPITLWVIIPTDLFILYFVLSPLFGYVELREKTVFIKFGFFLSREIPYSKIRGTESVRKFYSDSMLSLKNSLDHVNIKYNTFDMVSVSVKDNDELIRKIEQNRKQNLTY